MTQLSRPPPRLDDASLLIAGAGIGGLSAALACQRLGLPVTVFERAEQVSEHGAGIQLGPNAMRVLQAWGLMPHVKPYLVLPELLQVRSAERGHVLGQLTLGATLQARYGAPYGLIHRGDLHRVLLEEVAQRLGVAIRMGHGLQRLETTEHGVQAFFDNGAFALGCGLLGADGGFSKVRQALLGDGVPQATGHVAYRALLQQHQLPASMRSQQVTVWLGRGLHVVQYPVRQGDWLNVVVLVEGQVPGDLAQWDHSANARDVQAHLQGASPTLRQLVEAVEHWRLWALSVRPPMRGAYQQAQGRVALLGDAAHPMLPYLAQGAAMAIEDAQTLAASLASTSGSVSQGFQRYAQSRWRRNARVQAKAQRNGQIFHAHGLLAWGRDLGMRVLGESLLNMPWLYGWRGSGQ
jgi:salicylate hydroxylase